MNGPDDPSTDDVLEQLLDGIGPPGPLADEVERHLRPRGPVAVDDAEVDAVVRSLADRFAAERAPSVAPAPPPGVPANRGWRTIAAALAAAAVLVVVASLSWQAGLRAATRTDAPDEAPLAVAHDPRFGETEVQIAPGSDARRTDDAVVLVEGVVSLARTDPRQVGPHEVLVSTMDLQVEPVGTAYSVGVRGDLAAIWVREGRVRLLHQTEGHLGEITAGSWTLVTAGGPALELHRVPDGPFDPTEIGLDPSAAQLLADMRWLALPEASRSAILEPLDAPGSATDER